MTKRRDPLPNRRASETFAFECRGHPYVATIGFYPDGRLGEVFLRSGKVGTDMFIAMTETAIAVSFALQHGCDFETMRKSFPRREDGTAEGAVGHLLDMLAKRPVLVSVP